MEIVLLRHGKPATNDTVKLTAGQFGEWVAHYDAAGIDSAYPPPQPVITKAAACVVTVCSNLTRSVQSAMLLGVKKICLKDALFREYEMPYTNWKKPGLKTRYWCVLFRILQMLGYAPHAESFAAFKIRAQHCAAQLSELAHMHGSVLFAGHGFLNRFIAKGLLSLGWSGTRFPACHYWEYAIYTL